MSIVTKTKYSGIVLFQQENYHEGQVICGTSYKQEEGKLFLLNNLSSQTSSNAPLRPPYNWVEISPNSLKNLGTIQLNELDHTQTKKPKQAVQSQQKVFIPRGSESFLLLQSMELKSFNFEEYNSLSESDQILLVRPVCIEYIKDHPDTEWKEFIEELIRKNYKQEAKIIGELLRSQNIIIDNVVTEEEKEYARSIKY